MGGKLHIPSEIKIKCVALDVVSLAMANQVSSD
jgi:hypothetical protein